LSKSKVITLSGVPGTGTTTIARLLSEQLEIRMVYIGEIFRNIAEKYNMTLEEFSTFAQDNPKIDNELDEKQIEYAKNGDIILEGRLSGCMLEKNRIDSFKILLTADLDTRIKRIMGREDKEYDQVKSEILFREECERDRYLRLYNMDYLDESHYDLIINTTNLSPEEIVDKIVKKIRE
jgi:predicted cytidylate kinase